MHLLRSSHIIMQQNKRLLVFPIIAALLVIALMLVFLIPVWRVERMGWELHHITVGQYFFALVYLLVFFFFYHLILHFSAAINTKLLDQLFHQQKLSLRVAWQTAVHHLARLFIWTLLTTTIGISIRMIEAWNEDWHKKPLVQKYLHGLFWSIAKLFVYPILILTDNNMKQALAYSSELIEKTWGAPLRMRISWGVWMLIARTIAFIPLLIAYLIGGQHALSFGIIFSVILHLGISIYTVTTANVLISALYFYASENKKAPSFYSAEALQKAFRRVNSLY